MRRKWVMFLLALAAFPPRLLLVVHRGEQLQDHAAQGEPVHLGRHRRGGQHHPGGDRLCRQGRSAVFVIIGASFGPICGAMLVDYLLSGKKWSGPRAGFNPAGWIAWALGFVVGILPNLGVTRPGGARARVRRRRGGLFPLRQDGHALARGAGLRRAGRSDQVSPPAWFSQPALARKGFGGSCLFGRASVPASPNTPRIQGSRGRSPEVNLRQTRRAGGGSRACTPDAHRRYTGKSVVHPVYLRCASGVLSAKGWRIGRFIPK